MRFGPRLRKLVLIVHVAASVGWVGAVLAYLPLDVTAATEDDEQALRAAYVGMDIIADRALVPLAILALATGIAISLGTPWGIFRHYWVVISLVLTIVAFLVLMSETRTIGAYAAVAADPASSAEDVRALESTLPHSIGGLIVLGFVLVLNMVKPRGLTRYGWRKQKESSG